MRRFSPLDELKVVSSSLVATKDNATLASAAVEMKLYDWLIFIINTTDADADTTIDAEIQQDTASGFSTPTTVTDADGNDFDIDQFTAAATAKQAVLVVNEMDISEPYVRCLVTAGNGTSGAEISIIVLGHLKHYAPGDHASTVVEVKALDIS